VEKPILAWPLRVGTEHSMEDVPLPWGGLPGIESAPTLSPPILLPERDPHDRRHTPPGAAEELQSLLARAVTDEVVPRLLQAQRVAATAALSPYDTAATAGPEDVVALVALVVTSDVPTAISFVESLRARGASLERLYLDLLAPAARRLGQLWVEDLCSFADVTMALARLQHVVREMSPAFVADGRVADARRRIALLPMPGEQHTFGLVMVTEFFHRAGWDVWTEPATTEAELLDLVGQEWFAVIGLSVGCDALVPRLPAFIRTLRRTSFNPEIGVMVGGRPFSENPDLARLVGADATAADGRQATLQAETLLALLPTRAAR
jgi:methanogenic corrinoid protein MtbC1